MLVWMYLARIAAWENREEAIPKASVYVLADFFQVPAEMAAAGLKVSGGGCR